MINKNISLLFLTLTFLGCSSGAVDKLVTLKKIAQEQDSMMSEVQARDDQFERMLNEVDVATWPQFTHQSVILDSYGEPVVRKPLIKDGKNFEVWLYRYQTRYFDSPKIYLTFDEQDGLVKFETVKGQQKEE